MILFHNYLIINMLFNHQVVIKLSSIINIAIIKQIEIIKNHQKMML